MRAVPGAIEHARLIGGAWHFQTIDNVEPIGICGSGILEIIATLFDHGFIEPSGRLKREAPGWFKFKGGGALKLFSNAMTGDILLTRHDINEIQLAKAAIRAGIEIILEVSGLQLGDIDHFVVAGAFGTYLDIPSAIKIGMFPDLPLNKFEQVGNAAGIGARNLLKSVDLRHEAEELQKRVNYIELTGFKSFQENYIEAISFN